MKAGLLAQLRKTDLALAKRLGIVVLGILVFTVMTPALIGLRLNNSPSLPVGIYIWLRLTERRHSSSFALPSHMLHSPQRAVTAMKGIVPMAERH